MNMSSAKDMVREDVLLGVRSFCPRMELFD